MEPSVTTLTRAVRPVEMSGPSLMVAAADPVAGRSWRLTSLGTAGSELPVSVGVTSMRPFQPEKRATDISLCSSVSRTGPATLAATLECELLASCGFAEPTTPTSPPCPSSAMTTFR